MRYNILGGNLCHYYYLFFKCQLSNWKRFSGKKKNKKPKTFYWGFHMRSFGIIMTIQKEFNWWWNSNLVQVIFFFNGEKKKVLYLIWNKNTFEISKILASFFLCRLLRTGLSPENRWQWLGNARKHIILQIKLLMETGVCHFCSLFQVCW